MIRFFMSSRASPAISEALISDALSLADQRGLDYFALMRGARHSRPVPWRQQPCPDTWSQAVNEINDQALSESHYACFYALAKSTARSRLASTWRSTVLGLTRGPHDPERCGDVW
jgi:hypothetical protein